MSAKKGSAGLGSLLAKTTARMGRALAAALKEKGIPVTVEQWSVLAAAAADPGCAQARIAEKGLKDVATVARIIDVLERDGLLMRKTDAHDRRAYRVHLSEAGARTVEKTLPLVIALNRRMTRGFSQSEILELARLLSHVEENLKAE